MGEHVIPENQMRHEKLDFDEGSVEVTVIDNIIYMKTLRSYTDAIATAMLHYLDPIIEQIPEPTIRIWDSRTIHPNNFHLTSSFVRRAAAWSKGINAKRPGSKVYFLTNRSLVFGISRMYEMQASTKHLEIVVLSDPDQLPVEIRKKIPLDRK
jgi:hypothetical protein